jgi:hypothetical protein
MNWDGIVSLLIASIEALLIFNLLFFVDKNKINYLIIILIFLFASYQFMEFLICNQEKKTPFYPYLAFIIITLIPALNFILINRVIEKYKNFSVKIFEIFFSLSAVSFIIYYGLNSNLFTVEKCTVFYATYNYPLGFLYGIYYYLPILLSFLMLLDVIKKSPEDSQKKKLRILLIGYFFIITPPIIGFILRLFELKEISGSMESILCKFAFFYALAISFYALYNSRFKDERNYFKYLSGN